jgi:hypothetical protein
MNLETVSNVDVHLVGWALLPVDAQVFIGQECPIYGCLDRAFAGQPRLVSRLYSGLRNFSRQLVFVVVQASHRRLVR